MPALESVACDTTRANAETAVVPIVPSPAEPVRPVDARAALMRLAEDLRRRRKGAGASDAHECTVVAVTALTLDGRRTGKTFLAQALYVSSRGLAVLLDRPAPATSFVVEWEDAPPMTFDLSLSRRTRGRYEAALVLREEPATTFERAAESEA